MSIKVEYSAYCDECHSYAGSCPTRAELSERMRRQGWFRKDGKVLCGCHRKFPDGTKVIGAAGVNPVGQSRTWQGVLHLARDGGGTIWKCGHQHRKIKGEEVADTAFECARQYALSMGYVLAVPDLRPV